MVSPQSCIATGRAAAGAVVRKEREGVVLTLLATDVLVTAEELGASMVSGTEFVEGMVEGGSTVAGSLSMGLVVGKHLSVALAVLDSAEVGAVWWWSFH